jgi:hypothetical protein
MSLEEMSVFHVFGSSDSSNAISSRSEPGRCRKGARKPVVTCDKLQKARTLLAQGLNVREMAAQLKIERTALSTTF